MEPNQLPQESERATGCANCSHPVVEPGYPTSLCSDCRAKFIKYPIPLSVKLFGLAIVLLVAFSMFSLPSNLSAGLHFERGVDAISKKKYATALKELSGVLEKKPNFNEAKEYLAIAAFHNGNIGLFAEMIRQLEGKQEDDEQLLATLNSLILKVEDYLPSDSLIQLIETYHSMDSIPLSEVETYVLRHPGEPYATARLAALLLDQNRFKETDSLLSILLAVDPSYLNALVIKTSVKRQLKQFDSSHYYCRQMLIRNPESSYALASNARTFLMEGNDAEGLQWALNANAIEPGDGYVVATLSLAYHFNNKAAESTRLMDILKKDSSNFSYLEYVEDVKSGKEKFRN
ncbi:MAG: hypothetical protein QM781_00085 [Chitinophagaceae bacterium]